MIVQETGGFHKSKTPYESCKDFASSLVEGINRHKSLKNTLNSIVCMRPLLRGIILQLLWLSLRFKVAGLLRKVAGHLLHKSSNICYI